MNVADEILAEMALDPPEDPPCHFARLPIELRKRIYALLLLSAPASRVHCSVGAHTKQCSPGGRFLASTCKPKATTMRTISCGTCEWRGGDVHTAIMCTNKAINAEASEVLYENCQILFLQRGSTNHVDPLSMPREGGNKSKIRRVAFAVVPPHSEAYQFVFDDVLEGLRGLKVVELHLDVDLTMPERHRHRAGDYFDLTYYDNPTTDSKPGLELVIDVHITRAWNDPGSGWLEPISRRENISEARALDLDEEATQMRLEFIEELGEVFQSEGKTLVTAVPATAEWSEDEGLHKHIQVLPQELQDSILGFTDVSESPTKVLITKAYKPPAALQLNRKIRTKFATKHYKDTFFEDH